MFGGVSWSSAGRNSAMMWPHAQPPVSLPEGYVRCRLLMELYGVRPPGELLKGI